MTDTASLASVRRHVPRPHAELVLDRGEDVWVWDTDGNRYLDATASLWYANVGHGRQEIADAAMAQMRRLEAYSAFGDFTTQAATDLSARLAELSPRSRTPRSSSPRAAATPSTRPRSSPAATGRPSGSRSACTSSAASTATTAPTGSARASPGSRPTARASASSTPRRSSVPHDDVAALAAAFERIGPENVAAFFCEPVIGAGGVYPPAPGYLEACAALCEDAGVLFVADCVICGFGRRRHVVRRRAVRHLEPDMITFAKGVTSGYLPLGGARRERQGGRAVLGGRHPRRCSATARRTPRTPRAARRGWRTSTSWSARSSSRAGRSSRATCSPRWRRSRSARWSRRSAAARGSWQRSAAPGGARRARRRAAGGLRGRPRGGRARARAGGRRGDLAAAHDPARAPRPDRRWASARASSASPSVLAAA